MKHGRLLAFLFLLGCPSIGCSPRILLVDRHTVLEDEAAGEWPDFEKKMLDQLKTKSPTAYRKVESSESRKKLFHVLNGEWVSDSQATLKR